MLSLFSTATRTHRRSIDQTALAGLAQAVLADVQAELDRGAAPQPVQGKTYPGFPPEYKYDLEFASMGGPGFKVKVVIHYGGAGAQAQQESFETVLIRNADPGAPAAQPKKKAPAKGGS